MEAIKLGVGLLFKEGGALEVQTIMFNHLSKTNSELFFKQVRLTLQKLQAWHNWNQVIVLKDGEEPKPPDEILIVRFLQLMCEGHYLPNQDIMREQPNNRVSYNLLDDFVNYLNCLSRIPCRTSSVAGIRLSATILEVIQGPCEGNQVHFALNTELVETLNRVNRAKLIHDQISEEEIDLKKTSIDILQGLLEGQGEKSVVYERVLSVIHLDIIQIMSKKPLYSDLADNEEQAVLQTECVVLLQMLCNFKPSLYDELGISRNIEDIVGSGTAMIEVVWRGDIHRRFFHVPNICEFLAKSSKDALVENVDRSNSENKLIDFLDRSYVLYREVKHQQLLTELGISGIFSRENQNRATWITFFLTLLINAFFLANYSHRNGFPEISPLYNTITFYINVIQCVVAAFTLLLWVVVRSPVNYQTFAAAGCGYWETILYTATDPLTVYYVWYLVISILGVILENYYCALLLLDIVVKNSTTRDVLMSIITPRKQLVFALILEIFVIYIYAFFIFFFFRNDIDPYCHNLFSCLKVTLSYGFQNGGGIADSFEHTTGIRLILDLTFFCVVLVILLNVFLGMIIDTFSSLRADKIERMRDTLEVCFICNIDKQIFDRASDEPDGFKTHVKIDHNMWNYLYFIFLLWEQDRDDDDGLEQYVRRAIDANEIVWFPMNKAMRLETVSTKQEILRKDLEENIKSSESVISNKFDDFQTDLSGMLQGLMSTLKQEHHNDNSPMLEVMAEAEDEASQDGISITDNSVMTTTHLGKQVVLSVDRVEGIELPLDDQIVITCRLVTEQGLYSIASQEVDFASKIITFNKELMFVLYESALPKDRRKLLIQILKGERTSHFLSVIEIDVTDLLFDNEDIHVVEKKFTRVEQSNLCSIFLNVKNVPNTMTSAGSNRPPFTRSNTIDSKTLMTQSSKGSMLVR